MTKEYTFSTVTNGVVTSINPDDDPAPLTFEDALRFYRNIEGWYGSTMIRVLELNHDEMTFRDVTERVMNELWEREDEHRRMIMIDAAHDIQERHGWEQV